uniref:Ig-like domain-containing protein n=1 Tax=Pyxicephalus adspersus TaxID=30357 RepID=A0AAV3A643_PYXAD|nr:TPA: hypothetical protein GDO54_013596 [Pyxicephalus adspersus]
MADFCSGTSASIVLTQNNDQIAEVGKSVQLECEVSGYNINDHHMHWFRLELDGKMVWISAFRTGHTTYINDDFKGRVTPSTRGSTALLKIDRVTVSDSAMYYCSPDTAQRGTSI